MWKNNIKKFYFLYINYTKGVENTSAIQIKISEIVSFFLYFNNLIYIYILYSYILVLIFSLSSSGNDIFRMWV